MNLFFTIILGVVQGLSEFLPISSSGHLIIFRDFLNFEGDYGLAVDAILQLATTFAILIYFHKDFISLIKSFFSKNTKQEINLKIIIIATVPIVILGLLLEKYMETIFRSSLLVAFTLIIGSIVMILAEKFYKNRSNLNIKNGFLIGLFQSLALIPGMSRSGMTISGGLFSGLNRELATRFSFILAAPILFASGFKKLIDLNGVGYLETHTVELIFGSATSFIFGLLAIHFLINFLKRYKLHVFIYYRIFLAIIIIFLTF